MPSNVKLLAGASGGEPTDANFKNVTLLLHGDGSNGAQNNTFIDSSTNNFTITRNGNTTQGSFSPYGSNWSNYFDGSGDYLDFPSSSAFGLGTGNFTVEGWFYATSTGSNAMFWAGTTSGSLFIRLGQYSGTAYSGVQIGRVSVANDTFSSYSFSANTWYHIAVVRSGSTITVYVNGTSINSFSNSIDYGSTATGRIGANETAAETFTGYISNVRVVKGTAVYTSAFTPSTTPLTAITNTSLLTCAYNRFRDGSTNNFTITRNGDVKVTNFAPFAPSSAYSTTTNGGSAYFDGSGDYLVTPSSTALTLASGDFTIEAWVYPTALNASQTIVDFRTSGSDGSGFFFGAANTTQLQVYAQGSINIIGGTLTNGQWQHVACVRSGSTVTLYINGVSVASGSNSTNWTRDLANIGAAVNTVRDQWNGFVSNLRIVKGTAVYTAAFTPPSSPVTAITNTSLLLNATNAAIFDNSMKNDLETVGNAQISTSVKKFGTGSMAFDGSGDYLVPSTATADHFAFGSGDFTIEFWLNPSSNSIFQIIYDGRPEGSPSANAPLILMNGQTIYYQTGGSTRITGSNLSTSTWYHIALARSGTSTKMFVNGTQVGSTYTDSTVYTNSAARPVIGGDGNAPGFNSVNGYIDDLRVTKGVARYTANFTAPTAPFPNK